MALTRLVRLWVILKTLPYAPIGFLIPEKYFTFANNLGVVIVLPPAFLFVVKKDLFSRLVEQDLIALGQIANTRGQFCICGHIRPLSFPIFPKLISTTDQRVKVACLAHLSLSLNRSSLSIGETLFTHFWIISNPSNP
jgi:hypothetical protein